MITKITSTLFFAAGNIYKNNSNTNKQNFYAQKGLKTDTVTFTGKNKQVENVINLAFEKLNQSRKNGKLSEFIGTTKNNINVYLRETSFGKTAELSLSNGKFGKKSFANYEIKRSISDKPEIINEHRQSAKKAAPIIEKCLKDLK